MAKTWERDPATLCLAQPNSTHPSSAGVIAYAFGPNVKYAQYMVPTVAIVAEVPATALAHRGFAACSVEADEDEARCKRRQRDVKSNC